MINHELDIDSSVEDYDQESKTNFSDKDKFSVDDFSDLPFRQRPRPKRRTKSDLPDTPEIRLAARIRSARANIGWTQEQVSDALKGLGFNTMNQRRISVIEFNGKASFTEIEALAIVCKVSISYFEVLR